MTNTWSYCYRLVDGMYRLYRFNSTHRRAAFIECVPGKWKITLPLKLQQISSVIRWVDRDNFSQQAEIVRM